MTTAYAAPNTATMADVPLAWLVQSFYNPRRTFSDDALDELAASLEEHGMLEPIVVREVQWPTTVQMHGTDGKPVPCLEIIAGERRWRAARRAGMGTVPVRVLTNVDDHAALKLSIVENLQRVDLDPIEEAQGYAALHDHAGMKQTEIAAAVKRSQPAIAKSLGLLKLPEDIRALISDGTLSAAHGHVLERYADFPRYLHALVQVIIEKAWSSKELAGRKCYVDYPMQQSGVVRSLRGYEARFDTTVCQSCPFGAYRAGEYSAAFCLKPEHFDELQAAALLEQKEKLEIAVKAALTGGKPVLQTSDLTYDSYKDLGIYKPPAGCSGECPCRAQAADAQGKIVPICTNPKRYDQLCTAETKAKNRLKREHIAAQLAAVEERLAGLKEIRSAEIAVLIAKIGLSTISEKAWRAAAAHYGVADLLPEKGLPTYEDLVKFNPLDLLCVAVDASLTHDLQRAMENEYYGTQTYTAYEMAVGKVEQ